MVCVFFGHADAPSDIREKLKETVRSLIIEKNVGEFYVGDSGGFDGLAYSVLKELAKEYDIDYCKVHAYFPKDDRDHVPQRERENPDHSIYPEGIENSPPRFAVDYRNRWLVKKAEIAAVYINHYYGKAEKYAAIVKRRGCEVINLGAVDLGRR